MRRKISKNSPSPRRKEEKKKSNMDLFLLCQEKELYASGFKAEQAVTDEAAAVC